MVAGDIDISTAHGLSLTESAAHWCHCCSVSRSPFGVPTGAAAID